MLTQGFNSRLVSQIVSGAARGFIRNVDGVPQVHRETMYRMLAENNILREDQTREIDQALTMVARRDLVAVADLNNLVTPCEKGIAATSFEFDRVAPVGEATQSMSILNLGERDLVSFARTAIPVPVTASTFTLDARQQAAGTVDVTNVEEHTRSVAEKLEDTLTNGSSVVLGGNALPGYTNFGSREQVSFSDSAWSALSAGVRSAAVVDVLAMRAALRDNGFTGPYTLYLPANWDEVLDDDYKAESDRTLRERLMVINGVSSIKILPALSDSEALLVQMTRSVVTLARGQDITTVTWDEMGGLATNWAILAVISFALKAAYARAPLASGTLPSLTTTAGIAHIS